MSQTPEQIALERIKQNAESKAETLDLARLNLSLLPDELFELKHLKELNLSINNLTSISPKISQLSNLTHSA